MKRRDYFLAVALIVFASMMTPLGRDIVAQTSYSVSGWLGLVTDTTNDSLQVSIVSDTSNTGTTRTVAQTSYSLTSSNKAANVLVDYTTTGIVGITLDSDLLVDGAEYSFVDVDGNANTNNIQIGTEGAETINGAATYTMDADNEAITLISDGTQWLLKAGYLE